MRCSPIVFTVLLLTVAQISSRPLSVYGTEPRDAGTQTVLDIEEDRFTINGEPVFLLGISYYAGLGASQETVQRDLDTLHRRGFNWLRVFASWDSSVKTCRLWML
jgi:hypothetical protein